MDRYWLLDADFLCTKIARGCETLIFLLCSCVCSRSAEGDEHVWLLDMQFFVCTIDILFLYH